MIMNTPTPPAAHPPRQECDFEGRPVQTSNATNAASPPSVMAGSPEGQCHLAFTGLDKTGHDLRTLRVTAHFGVDSVHKVGKVTSPIKASLEEPYRTLSLHLSLIHI